MTLSLLALAALLALGTPIAYALGIAGLLAIMNAAAVDPQIMPLNLFNGLQSYTLVAIPLFILMGQLMTKTSLATRLIDLASALVGFVRGGLGMATVATGTGMAAISGSSVADASALGSTLIPQMHARGYSKGFAVAIVSASATIAMTIPPSIAMVLYGVIAQVSISDVFIAGIIPGIITALCLMVTIYLIARKQNLPTAGRFQVKVVWQALKRAGLVLGLPLVVIGGIMGGFFTPTEAAGIGVAYSLALGIGFRELTMKKISESLAGAGEQTAVVMLLVGTTAVLGGHIAQQQIPQQIAEALLSVSTNPTVILTLIVLMLLVGGIFIHGTPLIIMSVPILAPLAQVVGIDLIHLGIAVCIAISIGQITPPVASVLIVTTSIADIRLEEAIRPLVPLFVAMLFALGLVIFMPQLSLILPNMLE